MRKIASITHKTITGFTILWTVFLWGVSALNAVAHGGADLTSKTAWTHWNLTPAMVITSVLVLIVYGRGMARRRQVLNPPSVWRHVLFLAGMAVVFLALQSPIDPMAERLFSLHQVQHILLRMLGPMLITLSWPEGVFIAGLPTLVRRRVLAPMVSNGGVRSVFRFLSRAPVAFLVFLVSLYFWQIPAIHNAAILNDALHYVMHITMLAAGLLFFYLMFDRRDTPAGIPYPVRILMLIGTAVSNTLIGSITTLKTVVVYTAYDVDGRLFGLLPLADESIGGYIMWMPASMMCLIAILLVLHAGGKQEERRYAKSTVWTASNSAALEFPQTAEELRIKVKTANRSMGLTLAMVSASMFILALSTVIVIHVLF
ncbi:MAG: cytochrome c oxidase assembly protein [Robiginitomaculum sp.]|nr:cytochrome c oxidase assembly protein [Robiginitomaculum sp.]MDQ7076678.1 cytochrome c oxidase assembly protein [Robiginitomaculum sp.]